MSAPQFTQSTGEVRLYWLDDASWAPSGAFGLVLFPGDSTAPATLSLSQSFVDYPGYYVSIANKPQVAEETTFVNAILALGQRLGSGARFIWLDSAVPDASWSRRVLYVNQTSGAGQGTIDRPTVFPAGRYRFSVSAGQTIAPTTDGFAITGTVTPYFQFLTDDKAWPLVPTGAGATVLSVSGATAGSFSLNLSLDNGGGKSDYDLLGVGFRYGVPDQSDSAGIFLKSLYYPLFRGTPSAVVTMTLQLDPAGIVEPTRTRLAYRGTIAAQDTHYTTQLGYGVTLTPNTATSSGLPSGLAFHRCPEALDALTSDDPLYLAPIGPFTMTVASPPGGSEQPAARLTGGLSGSEYFGFSSGSAVPITFVPQQAAFAPDFPPREATVIAEDWTLPLDSEARARGDDGEGPLQSLATTAFALIAPPNAGQAWYFAQPDGAAFFHVENSAPTNLIPYLSYLELVAGTLGSGATPYPLVPYAGGSGSDLSLVRELERQILSPLRRAALGVDDSPLFLRAPQAKQENGTTQAVTPQGILATFAGSSWSSVTFSPAPAGTVLPQLAFNTPSATFRGALQSNQLFLVATDGAALMANAEFNYWITEAVLGDLARLSGSEAVPQSVITTLSTSGRAPQTSLAAFTTMLQGILTGPNAQYIPIVTKYAVYFQLEVEGWRFRLSPSLWADQTIHPPIMIFKYAAGTLYDFVQNTDAWAWPQIAGDIAATQASIIAILDSAIATVADQGSASSLYNFVTQIVSDPGWTGMLFLNANVPFSSVPPELSGLAAGILPDEFRAHHVGISVTPTSVNTTSKALAQSPSAIFGLIDYDQQEDIAHIEGDFDFKVLLLQVLFANSAIVNFAARIELFVNRLFGELVTLYSSLHYNNILLDGSYQRQGTSGHYVFASYEASVFGADTATSGTSETQTVLQQTQFDQTQFVTATLDTVSQSTVMSRFLLQGKLRFAALDGFDAFSFGPTLDRNGVTVADGYLSFSGASVDMSFPVNAPETRTFRFNLDQISFDPASSLARSTSFFQRFPLQLGGFIRGTQAQKPRDVGFLPLETPLTQPGFSGEWFGLPLAIDLGTLGALSSAPALSASILTAWSPGAHGHDVNIGLKMPGIESARALLPLEGVIDLGFQSIDLQAPGSTDTPPNPSYTLRFRNFYLRLLGWKFPPGQNTIMLFGNPDAASQSIATDRGALGWYAAYAKKE